MKIKRIVIFLLAFAITIIAYSPIVSHASLMKLSTDRLRYGVVGVNNTLSDNKRIRIEVHATASDKTYYVPYYRGDEFIDIPLMFGNGEYTISLYSGLYDNYYEFIEAKTVYLNMGDYDNIYLSSSVFVPWSDAKTATKKADELAAGKNGDYRKFYAIYDFVTQNVKYDFSKIDMKRSRSSPDETLACGSGTCMDFSVLLAAMLRCSGYKCKLVYGYKNGDRVYHSWNEVYLGDKWVTVDPTADAQYYECGIPFSYFKAAGDYVPDVAF